MKLLNNLIVLLLFTNIGLSQFINAGKITYERKTNLYKKFPDPETRRWMGNEKYRIDNFDLYFNDTMSFFTVQEAPSQGRSDWATVKNTHVTFLKSQQRHSILNIMGEDLIVIDSLKKRPFKRLGKKREIAGFSCQMVRFDQDDSTRLYAWYSDAILPSVGPETYLGLPGAILGLATEDGGVVYFATKVEALKPDFETLIPKYKEKQGMTEEETKNMLIEKMKNSPWGKTVLKEFFMW